MPIAAGLGLQYALICLASIVLTPTVMITVAGGSDAYLSWAVFAALLISGLTTAIQARSVGGSARATSSSWGARAPFSR